MTHQNLAQQDFLAACNSALGFLVAEFGFSPPEIDVDNIFVRVTFYKKEIAVECILDNKEDDVTVKIMHLTDGKKPDFYRMNEKGEVVRDCLIQLLLRLGIRDIRFDGVDESEPVFGPQADYRRTLLGYTRLLRTYGKDILAGSADIFRRAL